MSDQQTEITVEGLDELRERFKKYPKTYTTVIRKTTEAALLVLQEKRVCKEFKVKKVCKALRVIKVQLVARVLEENKVFRVLQETKALSVSKVKKETEANKVCKVPKA